MVFDFDLRRPNLHNLLGHRPKSDMGQLINGDLDPTDHMLRHGDNLAFGLNKGPVRNSAELLQSDLTGDFLSRMESSFAPDLMLFDMPPFLVADDAHGFLSHVDGILLVVEAEKTTADQIERLEERIASLTNLIGVVLNKCQFPNDGARSDYDYGYKYGY
jgi:Mrp family chromosome partitioning ATPase